MSVLPEEEMNRRRKEALEQLKEGKRCGDCDSLAVITYVTGHGTWFMCGKHDDEWQKWLNDKYPRSEKWP